MSKSNIPFIIKSGVSTDFNHIPPFKRIFILCLMYHFIIKTLETVSFISFHQNEPLITSIHMLKSLEYESLSDYGCGKPLKNIYQKMNSVENESLDELIPNEGENIKSSVMFAYEKIQLFLLMYPQCSIADQSNFIIQLAISSINETDNETDENETDDNETDDNETNDNETDNETDNNNDDDNETDENETNDNETDNETDNNNDDDNETNNNNDDDNETNNNNDDDNETDKNETDEEQMCKCKKCQEIEFIHNNWFTMLEDITSLDDFDKMMFAIIQQTRDKIL